MNDITGIPAHPLVVHAVVVLVPLGPLSTAVAERSVTTVVPCDVGTSQATKAAIAKATPSAKIATGLIFRNARVVSYSWSMNITLRSCGVRRPCSCRAWRHGPAASPAR